MSTKLRKAMAKKGEKGYYGSNSYCDFHASDPIRHTLDLPQEWMQKFSYNAELIRANKVNKYRTFMSSLGGFLRV